MSAEAGEAIRILDPGECAWDGLAQFEATAPETTVPETTASEPAIVCVTAERSIGDAPDAAAARPVMRASPPHSRFDLAARPRVTRAAQIARTLDEAFGDERFRDAVGQADAARDRGDWATAQHEYGQALHLYPLHWGYCIQYAHAIKEQGLHAKAEIWYRSAVALGAPAGMVDEHLVFVAQRNGAAFARQGTIDLDVVPLLAPPTIHDIRVLGRLARVPGLAGEDLGLTLLREARDNRAVLMRMIAMPEFARSNRAFLDILRG